MLRSAVVALFTVLEIAEIDGECCDVELLGVALVIAFKITEGGASGTLKKKVHYHEDQ